MVEDTSTSHFQRNSRLFTALGVFGAISVYFTQLQIDTRWQRLGIVSSLTIFLLVAVTIQRNLPPESSDDEPFDYVLDALLQKPEHMVFYVSLWFLVISTAAIIIRYSDTFLFLMQFFVFLAGFAIARRIVAEIQRSFNQALPDDAEIELGRGQLPIVFSLHIIRNALYAVILGSGGLVFSWMWNLLVWEQLIIFKSPSLLSAIVVGVLAGIAAGGIVFTLIGLSMIGIHYIALWVRKQGIEKEFAQYMEKLGFNPEEAEETSSGS